jgi:beta-galactosidase
MRRSIALNQNWLFFDAPRGTAAQGVSVDLPHSILELPLNNFDETWYQKKACYCKKFPGLDLVDGARAFIDFEGVAVSCKVWLNDRLLGGHKGPFTPFSLEITDALRSQGDNQLCVEVDAREDPSIPPFGGVVDYLVYGGIYRGVSLRIQGPIYITHFHARPKIYSFGKKTDAQATSGVNTSAIAEATKNRAGEWSTEPCKAALAVELEFSIASRGVNASAAISSNTDIVDSSIVASATPETGSLRIEARLLYSGRSVAEVSRTISEYSTSSGLSPVASSEGSASATEPVTHAVSINFPALEDILPWDIENPVLYDLELSVFSGKKQLDFIHNRIGFRDAVFKPEGFFLNGRRVFLRGLNRHQSWPFAGYAMGPGAQRLDAQILKQDLGCIIVRTSHYPQSRHFLDACDELGLLVFAELPGWQHIGDEAWQDNALRDLECMIKRDRNHPSIVLWGVRINESPDDDDFYKKTNALAASLDPDRQRGGVRNFSGSALFEDVYTFNDFTHDGGDKVIAKKSVITRNAKRKAAKAGGGAAPFSRTSVAPYLITEHNGHMFPTKRWDQEERLAEHARRHARVLNAAMGDSGISGAIGWCAFDYNTHKDFGSGDRICYHGVADMFRSPKYAAFFYASQKPPCEGIVLELASRFAKGERSGATMLPVDVYTNCDAVDLYRSGDLVKRFFPNKTAYPYLEHPPVLIDDLIGHRLDPEGFLPADAKRFLRLAAKTMSNGISSFGIADKLNFAFLMLRRGLSFQRAQDLVIKYGLAWGRADDSLELVGILNEKPVVSRRFGPDAHANNLELDAAPRLLTIKKGGEWESSRIVLRLVDQYGNTCPFAFEPFHIELKGPGRLIGPADRSLLCGEAVFWIASSGKTGRIEITITSPITTLVLADKPLGVHIDVEYGNG